MLIVDVLMPGLCQCRFRADKSTYGKVDNVDTIYTLSRAVVVSMLL